MRPTGRFAPSPTGDLHFGSLVAAVSSFLQARARGGRWLIRVEDIDPPRQVPGSADRILQALARIGLRSDSPVVFQSDRTAAYLAARDRLLGSGQAFWCGCSRKELPASGTYPGTCRDGLPPGKSPRAVRLAAPATPIEFHDAIQGVIREDLATTCGDFVIWRADNLPAYQLAVVVDDAWQEVDEVVRGHDLLDSTARQIHVARSLGLAVPRYAHHPIAVDSSGCKLSKSSGADPVASTSAEKALEMTLNFLGQRCPARLSLAELWTWALANWDLSRVPRIQQVAAPF